MENVSPSLKLRRFVVNRIVKLEKRQKAFFEEIKKEKSLDDILTVKECCEEYKVSRKTFDRWRENGLQIIQKKPNSRIFVKRASVEQFLNRKNDR
ncbi:MULTISPECIES: helix-turn-helix domain-containing protein [Croceibacter]|uniref:helix-turn-helix domain-containing protein n=1 Tax=Croceibacter TaxID=216431 RepID=UPI000C3DD4D5|nr:MULTISPECIES: helix-turn-helix domain-containing protein [Croceibacter]MBG27025.1 hypothetical protein [Croceibacter sp.]|tara:strand:- start:775 stop:1059 length:285 start_codon:yes stop_codon:yes gene_type:complete